MALFSGPMFGTTKIMLMGFDRATPEQISLRCPLLLLDTVDAIAITEYKAFGSTIWINAGPLTRIKLSELGPLPSSLVGKIGNSFVGWITGLTPGTLYDVRVRVTPSGQPEQIFTDIRATRSLPPAAPAITQNCTPENFQTILNALVPGDRLQLAAGTYLLTSALTSIPSGTLTQPIYITAGNLGDVVISRPTGTCLAPNSDYVVWEKIKFTGSGVDSGLAVTSQFCNPNTSRRNVGWCWRFCEITGFDAAFKCFEPVDDFLIYECLLSGNNNWQATYTDPINQTWDDSGLQFPGSGNAAWNNTIKGFGDTFRCHTSSGIRFTAGNYYWRNHVEWGGDNAFEADDSSGNVAAYDNYITNSGDMFSVDVTYGPTGFFRNTCINTVRGPLKVTSISRNTRIVNNTFIITTKASTSAHGLLTPSAVGQYGLEWRNNLFVYYGPGNIIHWSSPMFAEIWSNNAWTDGVVFINGTGNYINIGAAKVGNPSRFAYDVVVPAQPFINAIILGSDYTTQIFGQPSVALAANSTAANAGGIVPGITDGFSGLAPDIGANISGRTAVTYGRT